MNNLGIALGAYTQEMNRQRERQRYWRLRRQQQREIHRRAEPDRVG